MKVLIACEFSGVMRRAFRALGHDAWSCDLLPAADDSEFHSRDDIFDFIEHTASWDLMIAHPPCTYLCNSGVRWLHEKPGRWQAMADGVAFFNRLWELPIPKMAIENPVMHKWAKHLLIPQRSQIVQPWWFGDEAFKATGWWLRGLPPLLPTNKLVPPKPGTDEHKRWSKVHRASPSPTRWAERSATYPGLAAACAAQWGAT